MGAAHLVHECSISTSSTYVKYSQQKRTHTENLPNPHLRNLMNAFVWKRISRVNRKVVCQHQSPTGNQKRSCHLLRESHFRSWIIKQHITFSALSYLVDC